MHSTLPHPAPPRTCVVTTHPCPAKHNIPPAAASTANCAVRQRNSRVVAVWPAAGGQKSQGYSGGGAGCVLVLRCRCCCLARLAEYRGTTRRTRPARRVVVVNQYWPAWPPRQDKDPILYLARLQQGRLPATTTVHRRPCPGPAQRPTGPPGYTQRCGVEPALIAEHPRPDSSLAGIVWMIQKQKKI